MAWFGEGFSSLKGQLTTLAKNVLIDEEETKPPNEADAGASSSRTSDVTQVDSGWTEAEEGVFIGQDEAVKPSLQNASKNSISPPNSGELETTGGGGSLSKGLVSLFSQIGGGGGGASPGGSRPPPQQRQPEGAAVLRREAATQTLQEPADQLSTTQVSQDHLGQLTQQNWELSSEVASLRVMVRDLQSQIATTQDENSNLSTGLEALDIQHQEAIERILTVKDEAVKEVEHLREQMRSHQDECASLKEENQSLLKQMEMMKIELMGSDTLNQENAELRQKLSELLSPAELPPIPEQLGVEEHVRTLEAEAAALRESRDNLERETATLLNQLRQRDATLREVDAKLEEISKEKEIKEREMTQIVFECNSLREELRAAQERIDTLEKDGIESRSEISTLKSQLVDALEEEEVEEVKANLERVEKEANRSREESATLKSELECLREDLGGGEAASMQTFEELTRTKLELEEARKNIQILSQQVLELEEVTEARSVRLRTVEEDLASSQEELDSLRNLARQYDIQRDLGREMEAELKRQLAEAGVHRAAARQELETLSGRLAELEAENEKLSQQDILYQEAKEEITKCKSDISELNSEKAKMTLEVSDLKKQLLKSEKDLESRENELSNVKSALQLIENDVDRYQGVIKLLEVKISNNEEQMRRMSSNSELNEANNENLSNLIEEKERLQNIVENQSKELNNLKMEVHKLQCYQRDSLEENKRNIDIISQLRLEKIKLNQEKEEIKKKYGNIVSELSMANAAIEDLKSEKNGDGVSQEELSAKLNEVKLELQQSADQKAGLVDQLETLTAEREQLIGETRLLREELGRLAVLKEELQVTSEANQEKTREIERLKNDIQRVNSALSTELNKNEIMLRELTDLKQNNEQLWASMQTKMSVLEEMESGKNKEIEVLKTEVETLKTQLEFASQLLQDVERQEGEGQPASGGDLQTSKKSSATSSSSSAELEEEIRRLSACLLKEQTDKSILQNQLREKEERLEKSESQLSRLKSHLVEVEETYSSEISTAETRLREVESLLAAAEERARSSTTAYTSASIRSNQQVEGLREQVRLLSEARDRLERQVSEAEDEAARQAAAVTRLQAVLHHFQIDKQKDIEFETERIRRDLTASEKRNEALQDQIQGLRIQLEEANRGLAAGQRLSDQLIQQAEIITALKAEIFELKEKLRTKEEKVNDLNSENKVDKQLVRNLVVGYVTAPEEAKGKVLGVLGQVLGLSKEERQRVGLEAGGRQQTLSEAFIKFLQSESQPRSEVILPLAATSSLPPSRKSSLLSTEVPSLPHFPVGRHPGSILKDVLQDRRPE